MRTRFLLLLPVILLAACHHPRKVSTCFYYWKTVYKQNPVEGEYAKHLHAGKMYVRIMDIDIDDTGTQPVPVSPIVFSQRLPDTVQMVPVVYIVNNVLKINSRATLNDMARKVLNYVDAKVKQAGKTSYSELQVDCDWTADTRDAYFYLLKVLKEQLKSKTLSVTLRLHQVKNQVSCGTPPVNKVMLMCYNMGNLRKYGPQNSIIEVAELKKYLDDNLSRYPMQMAVGLPLFSWAVAFRDKQYIGIARQVKFSNLSDSTGFAPLGNNLYRAKTDMPQLGLQKLDEVRFEDAPATVLNAVANYISPRLPKGNLELIYFHLDEDVLKRYTYEELENVADILR